MSNGLYSSSGIAKVLEKQDPIDLPSIEDCLNKLSYEGGNESQRRFRYKGFTLGTGEASWIEVEETMKNGKKRKVPQFSEFVVTIFGEDKGFPSYKRAFEYVDEIKDKLLGNVIRVNSELDEEDQDISFIGRNPQVLLDLTNA